ncbi:MAG: ion transporter [Butyrivibrio sp.]|uniref:ion transporter n=1 Tax=Butyrivibrio sp. TaxID=28121 RepID=UPI001B274DF3|nr:ion transporter [Butyrivibrio sp.]MBO6241968.1 ion transporter [Butyrivibrio sp.]
MRKRIFEIIEISEDNDKLSSLYDAVMLLAIIISILPLAFKKSYGLFRCTDWITTVLFIMDYLLRLITADYKLKDHSPIAFVKYPFTPWAIVDLISILPTLAPINSGFKLFRLFRIFRTFRIFRIFKAFRYSKSIIIIAGVINRSKEALLAVCTLAIGYILVSALVVFSVEGQSFDTFFDAVYWATVSLTTVGYGDIYPVTTAGRVITMLSSVLGIAIVALPAGIITAGYLDALTEEKKNKPKE